MSVDQQTDPTAALRTKASSLDSTLDTVRRKANLADVMDALEDIDSKLNALPGRLAQLRQRGYVFKNHLEAELDAIDDEWPSVRPRVQIDADYQRRLLTGQMDDIQMRFTQARSLIGSDNAQAEAALTMVSMAAETLGKSADGIISSLQGMYNSFSSRLSMVESETGRAEAVLKQIDQATFKLYPNECVIEAIEAQWMTDQKGGPKGVLFCTDHRLLFEQREEVATKKVLFIVTEKQKVQQLALEAPIGSVQEVKERESGALLFRKDHLDLIFGGNVKVRNASFILKGDSAEWQRLINRVNAGEMDKERVKGEEAPAKEAPKAMPTQCPACGARITQTVVRGMTNIKCQYCGTVIPL